LIIISQEPLWIIAFQNEPLNSKWNAKLKHRVRMHIQTFDLLDHFVFLGCLQLKGLSLVVCIFVALVSPLNPKLAINALTTNK